jgi:hypothetical protein
MRRLGSNSAQHYLVGDLKPSLKSNDIDFEPPSTEELLDIHPPNGQRTRLIGDVGGRLTGQQFKFMVNQLL